MTARTLAAALLVAALGTALAQPPGAGPMPPAPLALQKVNPKDEKPDLPKLLAARVTVQKFDGTFKDAVAMFADAYELPLIVDPRLREAEGMAACDYPDDKPVKLPKLSNVRLDTALGALLDQVNGKFLVYPDHVRVVPVAVWLYETGVYQHDPRAETPSASDDAPFLSALDMQKAKPLIKRAVVTASFKNKPLTEVIDDIAESTGATVTLSPLLPANVRQAPVTTRFANTPVDAAVRTLCEMTECGVIEDANVLLVTTRERATVRTQELAQKAKDRQSPQIQQFLRVAPGFGPLPQPDFADEIAKLKEQNNQLKKELEEIKRRLPK